jgi:hypothetical protein
MLINTMGFNVGLGVHIMRETIRAFPPTTIAVLSSRFSNKNYQVNFSRLCPDNCNLLNYAAMPESEDVKVRKRFNETFKQMLIGWFIQLS